MKQILDSKTPEHSTQKHSYTRRDFFSTSLKAGAAVFTTGLLPKLKADVNCQYNVLFIMVDDLRPLLGCYGHSEMHTPNIDRLAQRGTLFNRAYCQYPKCHPSRASMFTGLRPNTTRVLDNSDGFREKLPNVVTLPQNFKANGYHTQSVGKVAHDLARQDDVLSWSVSSWIHETSYDRPSVSSWQALDVEDDELSDGKITKRTIEVLEEIQDARFFLAIGFHKPHLPFYAPKKYYELYKDKNFSLPNTSATVSSTLGGISNFQDVPDIGPLSDEKILELIQAYAASVSFIDAQIGRVLNRLDALRLTENTVIVFAGDHGFLLGEHGRWGKGTLFEAALRSPLIISVPEQQPGRTDALVELVDIYPTLCDACQIQKPLWLEGISMIPVIDQPTRTWKTAAFSQIRTGNSMRTAQHRYTELGNRRELYDYYADPNGTINIANLPENAELVAQLSEQLQAGWQVALPDVSEQTPILQTLIWDINNDGLVDFQDLVLVSNNFGLEIPEHPKADINKDGKVDIIDLLIVASHLGESCTASAPLISVSPNHLDTISEWLSEAYIADDGSEVVQQGIATLERLFNSVTPEKTVLLPNFPNPFNPETWIPYDLVQDTKVDIKIYNLKGETIRELKIGFQNAGVYRNKQGAAYWDGRNSAGELVASGVYFYSLNTGRARSVRQMTVVK